MPVASDVPSPTNGPKQLSDGNTDGTLLGWAGTLPGGATDKIGFFGGYDGAAVTQPGAAGSTVTSAAGSTTPVYVNTTFTGGLGTTAYTVGDVVRVLKSLGLIVV